ncbi:hypothetical protein OIU85_027327 [Salix viminalis]|uniref:Uncharacterized protein n=1 Tax=Salix viminalis TaxID=40686 RepID=A0A9Q0TAX3_SALVM|nr:hypothetical protein OIU85_027327 [Salix viminalis]
MEIVYESIGESLLPNKDVNDLQQGILSMVMAADDYLVANPDAYAQPNMKCWASSSIGLSVCYVRSECLLHNIYDSTKLWMNRYDHGNGRRSQGDERERKPKDL